MSENDIIAEYVKENHPEILNTADFALYRISVALRKFINDFNKAFSNISIEEFYEYMNKERETE